MALKKVKKPELVESIKDMNDGFDAIFPDSSPINPTYNNPISCLNKNDSTQETDCDIEDIKEESIEEDKKIQELIKYDSKDDISPVLRTSKTDNELKKNLIINLDWNKVLTPCEYPAKVIDVYVEEVKYHKCEEFKRVHFDLEVMNDDPVEPVYIGLTASLNFSYNSKLSRVVRAILGHEVTGEFNLNNLIDKKVVVKTKIITDERGNNYHAIDTINKA